MDAIEIREKLKEMYGGENKPITDGNYDQSLAVKCINGTFVGRKTENVTEGLFCCVQELECNKSPLLHEII